MHPPTEDELTVELSWFEQCDRARQRLFEDLLPVRKWGRVIRVPADHVGIYLRCDFCRPKAQATYLMFQPERLYCDTCMKKYRSDQRVNWGARALREKLYEQQRDFNKAHSEG